MKRIYVILIIFCLVMFTIITTKFYNNYEKNRVVTYSIVDDTFSHYVYNDHLLALTKDGTLYVYDKAGKETKTNQTDLRFIGTYVDLIFIKNDGSIISDIKDDTYEGSVLGKIPGAVRGCKCYDTTVIVTNKGELYFKDDKKRKSSFIFRDTEPFDGWTRINDIKDVKKAVIICCNSSNCTLFVLDSNGEVYCCSDYDSYGGHELVKISRDYSIADISQSGDTLLLLDYKGSVYEYGCDIRSKSYYVHDYIMKIESFENIEKLSTSYSQGAVITVDHQAFVWQKKEITFGKACEWEIRFGELLEQGWDEIVPACEDYFYTIKDGVVRRIPTHTICNKVDSW